MSEREQQGSFFNLNPDGVLTVKQPAEKTKKAPPEKKVKEVKPKKEEKTDKTSVWRWTDQDPK